MLKYPTLAHICYAMLHQQCYDISSHHKLFYIFNPQSNSHQHSEITFVTSREMKHFVKTTKISTELRNDIYIAFCHCSHIT